MSEHAEPVVRWHVRYDADAPSVEILLPHTWRQDVAVSYEGPVTYRTTIAVPRGKSHLLFHNVSYAAEVRIDGETVASHKGIWDAFAVPLDKYSAKKIEVEVSVVKNGGPTYPVREVASGFLPFVYHTFGGIFGMVELVRGEPILQRPPLASRVRVDGSKIFVDDRPFYVRGLLHWGWYPEIGHPNPPEGTIREEVAAAKARGFNLVKFCLWVPSHRYLDILREEGMEAWIELPLWDPSPDPARLAEIAEEIERVVRQYRHHDNIVVWTVGCELSASTPHEYRAYLTQLVRSLTGSPLVKDNSGGAEMYGGDLREYGDLYDFHPYCDLPFYPDVLDSLLPGAREPMPTLLGEFNDIDVHRDLAKIGDEMPYWASSLPELNDKGVRWQYDLPAVLSESRFANQPTKSRHTALMASSAAKATFIRKTVQEAVRSRDSISGYVITGWRDTPISSAGVFDDWGDPRFSPAEMLPWNGETVLFAIPTRRPPWVDGGNRSGWVDPFNHFAGQVFWRIGVHSDHDLQGGLFWRVVREDGKVVAHGAERTKRVPALHSREVGQIAWDAEPGEYTLSVEFGGAINEWPVWVTPRLESSEFESFFLHDQAGLFRDLKLRTAESPDDAPVLATGAFGKIGSGILFLTDMGVKAAPFWREAAYEFRNDAFWSEVPFAEKWSRLLPVSSDRVIDMGSLDDSEGPYEVLLNRVDVRTYQDAPVLVRRGNTLVTTLRPYGGLGTQPTSLTKNPAGVALLRALAAQLS
ncbi:hypothetical protein [Fimbriimonas ginsengisoli]|uniref:Glycoside hydrolase family protein n=1 Tax=Fimbriimonas ginsengisoli Gsoil 348 TaxID=661478 RepID=A0A068NSH8_FIMGI|nr:hypothetical protein [Fimbriimonas ginsengisoli]AIE85725.1 glycoside hydrolase family protein [Fimbriimonas ginsengisoli Gsoil 348]